MRARLLLCVPALLLYFVACGLPALRLANGDVWSGGKMLGLGWLGVLLGQFGWLANFFWLGSMVFTLRGRPMIALGLAVIAAAIGLHMLALPGTEISLDEGGVNKTQATALAPGAWVWMAALAAAALGAFAAPIPRSAP
jgi:hypothetical protein